MSTCACPGAEVAGEGAKNVHGAAQDTKNIPFTAVVYDVQWIVEHTDKHDGSWTFPANYDEDHPVVRTGRTCIYCSRAFRNTGKVVPMPLESEGNVRWIVYHLECVRKVLRLYSR